MSKSDDKINISNTRIRQLREHLGLTIQEFADVLGCSRGYVSMIENGKRDVSGQLVILLQEKFHMTAESIFRGESPRPDNEIATERRTGKRRSTDRDPLT